MIRKYKKEMNDEKEQGRTGHCSKDQERTEKKTKTARIGKNRTGQDRKVIEKRKML